jgi:hypothetical protein
MFINNSIELIGMGQSPEDMVIYCDDYICICASGPVRITNLTLRHGTEYSTRELGECPLLDMEGGCLRKNETQLFLDNCIIGMRTRQ